MGALDLLLKLGVAFWVLSISCVPPLLSSPGGLAWLDFGKGKKIGFCKVGIEFEGRGAKVRKVELKTLITQIYCSFSISLSLLAVETIGEWVERFCLYVTFGFVVQDDSWSKFWDKYTVLISILIWENSLHLGIYSKYTLAGSSLIILLC